ncbi:MAG: HAD-IA family hydrolase [Kiloniellales bacterium]
MRDREQHHAAAPLTVFKVLTFDVVGTLIDFERGILDSVRESAGATAAALDDDAILDAYRDARAAPGAGWFPDDLVRVYREMAPVLGLSADEGAAERLRASVERWPAFPDSAAALERLGRRYRLVAMTNAQRWALQHFARTLGDPFDATVTVDDVGREKPDPQFFAFARGGISTWGYGLSDILHVAQSQYHDIGVARELGYTVCWIERRKGQKGYGGTREPARVTTPDYHFSNLAELADFADRAWAGAVA